jgi:hypothetical protein
VIDHINPGRSLIKLSSRIMDHAIYPFCRDVF